MAIFGSDGSARGVAFAAAGVVEDRYRGTTISISDVKRRESASLIVKSRRSYVPREYVGSG
jgi:hypothetical protein